MFSFDSPQLFWLLPLPWLVWRLLPPPHQEQLAIWLPFYQRWESLGASVIGKSVTRPFVLAALSVIWLGLVTASAKPMWYGDPVSQSISGREMLLAVDISDSMNLKDMVLEGQAATRIDAVKAVVSDFVQRRNGDKVGLVLFGTHAYTHVPLTFDLKTLRTLLLEAQTGFAGKKTAIGEAIGLSVKRLRDRPEQSRVVVLLTDGQNTAGIQPQEATRMAVKAGLKIYTIGVGANEMTTPGFFGTPFGQRKINPSRDLDEASLRNIAERTGGRYFRAANTRELEDIYQTLDRLEPVGQGEKLFRPQASLAHWPLALAFFMSLLLAIAKLLPTTKRATTGGANG